MTTDSRIDVQADTKSSLSSNSGYDTDLSNEDGEHNEEGNGTRIAPSDDVSGYPQYEEVCKSLAIVPIRKISEQLKEDEMKLQHIGMNNTDSKALACALWHNTCLEALDLEDNGLDGDGLVPIINVFKNNIYITSLSLSENDLGVVGAMVIDEVLNSNSWLTQLNLSGMKIGDKEMEYISSGIQHNDSLRWLNLSHNEISVKGAKKLGTAIGGNKGLQVLDLSWNHIRLLGAVALCKGLQKNMSIINMNMAWNGLGFEGSLALEEVLRVNTSLKFFDVSNNRINWEGVSYVAKGLRRNGTLQMLKIGNNPINMEGCYELIKAAAAKNCKILHLGLDNIPVNGAVLTVADEIMKTRPFSLIHGGVLDTRDIIGIRKEKPEDPVTLMVRYLAMIGMRIIDIFRMFDSENRGYVKKEQFIRGLKKIGVPLSASDINNVASRLDRQKKGVISYSNLVVGVRSHIREERMEDRRQEVKKRNKIEERRRILQTDLPPIYRKNYEDDMYLYYASQNSLNAQRSNSVWSIDSANSQGQGLPPINRTVSMVSQGDINELINVREKQKAVISAWRRKSTALPAERTEQKPMKLLNYMNKYLERRKTQANIAFMSLPSIQNE